MTHSAAAKARDWLLPLAMLWVGFAIAGHLLARLVPTTFLFLTWIDACRDSAIEQCRLGMFALPALFLACVLVIAAHAALPRAQGIDAARRERNRRTFRAALLGAACFVVGACAVPVLAAASWLPVIAAAVGSATVLILLRAWRTGGSVRVGVDQSER